MATISLVMIVKDEETNLERCIDSVKDIVDEYVVVDTGSTDRTKEIIAKYGKVYERPFTNFVDSKNAALALATGDYILFLDADEYVYENVQRLRDYAEAGVEVVSCDITEGSPDRVITTNRYSRYRLWKNNGEWHFEGPGVHEYIASKTPHEVLYDREILVRHDHSRKDKAATAADRFRGYVTILTEALEKKPDDTRALFYLARTHRDLNNNLAAISAYMRYLAVPDNTYRDERWQAAYDMAGCYGALGEYDKAFDALDIAFEIDPRRAETLNRRGELHMYLQDYEAAIPFYEKALTLEIPADVILFLNPLEYSAYPKDQLTLCYFYTKQYDKALAVCQELNRELPCIDPRILGNLWFCHKRKQLTFFLTLGYTPEQIYGGILDVQGVHGVETTYIELAKELKTLGHDVFLFCHTEKEHIFDGVYYVPYGNISNYVSLKPDVVITSRWFDALYLEDQSLKIVWLQDSYFADPKRPDAFDRADLIVCSSIWHRQYIAQRFARRIDAKKIKVIPLGIRKNLFEGSIERVPLKVIYSSNPDRGLYILADMWQELSDRVPEISLEVLYGWEGLKTWSNDPAWQDSVTSQKMKLLDQLQNFCNVTFTGRVTKAEVAKKMMSSDIMLYPNNFWETFCLTALESQAAGTPLVTSDLGALATTVNRDANILIQDDPFSSEYRRKFIDAAASLLSNRDRLADYSIANRSRVFGSPCDWVDVVQEWQTLIWNELK